MMKTFKPLPFKYPYDIIENTYYSLSAHNNASKYDFFRSGRLIWTYYPITKQIGKPDSIMVYANNINSLEEAKELIYYEYKRLDNTFKLLEV
jgi:hypothetical protein